MVLHALVLAVAVASAAPAKAPIHYLALGDSFTAGTGSDSDHAFPARLAERWRKAGREVALKNMAVNGYSSEDVIQRELGALAVFRPSFVTLAIGANDIVRHHDLAEFRRNVRAILSAMKTAGVRPDHIWVLPQPDWSKSPAAGQMGDPAEYAKQIAIYDAALRDEAKFAGATWIDLSKLMAQQAAQKQLADDGLHPSAAAYDAWAEALSKQPQP